MSWFGRLPLVWPETAQAAVAARTVECAEDGARRPVPRDVVPAIATRACARAAGMNPASWLPAPVEASPAFVDKPFFADEPEPLWDELLR